MKNKWNKRFLSPDDVEIFIGVFTTSSVSAKTIPWICRQTFPKHIKMWNIHILMYIQEKNITEDLAVW
jgi:hypothetical protein